MSEPIRWHGHEITAKEAAWFNHVTDLIHYCVELRDQTQGAFGIPDTVPIEIRDEMKLLLGRVREYPNTDDIPPG